jgi:hypothetical protein
MPPTAGQARPARQAQEITMKNTLLAALAALTALGAVAAPAMAQPYGPPGMGGPEAWDLVRRIDWTQDRIIHGRDDGSIDRREFDRVEGELYRIRHEDQVYRSHHDGHLDERLRVDLERRLDRLNDQIHWMREHNEPRPW